MYLRNENKTCIGVTQEGAVVKKNKQQKQPPFKHVKALSASGFRMSGEDGAVGAAEAAATLL